MNAAPWRLFVVVFLFVLFLFFFLVIGLFFLDRVSLYKPGWFEMQFCSLGSYACLCLLSDEIECLCDHTLPLAFYVLEKLLLDWGIPRSLKKEDYLCACSPAFLRLRQEDHLNTSLRLRLNKWIGRIGLYVVQ